MYGKKTCLRLAEETTWGETPAGGWVEAALVNAKVSLAGRVAKLRSAAGFEPGRAWAAATFETAPTAANLAALADAALGRGDNGEMGAYSVDVADAAGAWRVSGATTRRLTARSGIARPALELVLEMAAKDANPAEPFSGGALSGRHFTFGGSECVVAGEGFALKEFLLVVNNHVFVGPAAEDGGPAFVTAGRQDVTGYLVTNADRRDLIDGDAHAVSIVMPGDGAAAILAMQEVFFTWCREVRSAAAGALQALYFEGAGAGVGGGVSITLAG